MTVMEKIMQHIQSLPESLQTEVLDFVEYLEVKAAKTETDWSAFSLSAAMRGIEEEAALYSTQDLRESFK